MHRANKGTKLDTADSNIVEIVETKTFCVHAMSELP